MRNISLCNRLHNDFKFRQRNGQLVRGSGQILSLWGRKKGNGDPRHPFHFNFINIIISNIMILSPFLWCLLNGFEKKKGNEDPRHPFLRDPPHLYLWHLFNKELIDSNQQKLTTVRPDLVIDWINNNYSIHQFILSNQCNIGEYGHRFTHSLQHGWLRPNVNGRPNVFFIASWCN